MSGVARLTLVSHAMTVAMAAGRFPADEPLSAGGQVAPLRLSGNTRQLAAPEQRTRETAKLLGLQPVIEPRLADLDCGMWRGASLPDLHPADLETWLTDPGQAPHGGETVVELIDRVGGWLATVTSEAARTVAVTHPAVVRAALLTALEIPPKSFWRIDVAPLSRTMLYFRGQRWTLRL
ncbi:histidine phosphatase family protein [Mycobacterium vicinigordonae]|uniref:Histidine phosphatase family protein n=1 Tax=Mycobacterium vicinigordonae TaxID=1719132 RepID=A0A7D6DZ64_9MYCO|nr:histidine phosphatase family protein [Mycobacterium vicinigordonae]QLL07090.1 histidine phosphatase family protein [Mycobacterium vicinigordonae]